MAERLVIIAFSYDDADATDGTAVRPPMRRAVYSADFPNMVGAHNEINDLLDSRGLPWNSLNDLDKEVAHQVIEGRDR
jgi:hypothetical protein